MTSNNTFFASVRRNQKQWMVVLTVLSMVSFLFLDFFSGRRGGGGPMTPFGGAMMIGCLVAAGMCIIGYPRGLTIEFGSGGFVAGFLAGYLGFGAIGGNKPLVRTSVGNFSRQDIDNLKLQREKTNRFIYAVGRETKNQQMSGFGLVDDSSIVEYEMMLADAKKMGIQISDERVSEFLRQLFQNELSKHAFKECLREANLSENELFDALKSELSAQLVRELTEPPAHVPMVAPELARIPQMAQYLQSVPRRFLQQTPLQLWDEYEKLTLKESLQAVAIPVKDFVSKIPDPSESEIVTFFERHLGMPWTDEARPGFKKPSRVQLAYLTADFEKFEKGPEPTDAEVQEYYDKNKARYRVFPEKEKIGSWEMPDDVPSADQPANVAQTKPETAEEKKPANEVQEPPTDKPKTDAEKPSTDDSKSKCGDDPTPAKPADDSAAKDKASDAKAPPTGEAGKDNPASDKTEPATDKKAPDKPADEKIEIPELNASPDVLPGPKYRNLDDELKMEIREILLLDRAFDQVNEELDKAYDYMVKLGLDYDTTLDAAKKADKAKEIAGLLSEYAQSHKLEYKETAELSYEELSKEAIGGATENRNNFPVSYDVFIPGENGEPRMPLYSPHRAESKFAHESYAYWKIAQFKEEPANIKDDAVREKVIGAWKFDQARSLAEKRARDLVGQVKAEENNLTGALANETITGEKDSPVISVIPTDPFTWLSVNRNVPNAPQTPTLTTIPLIDDIGPNFMRIVFEELNDGDVGMASDEYRATYYVVKVIGRDTGNEDEGGVVKHERQQKFMKEEFASRLFPLGIPSYQYLAADEQRQIDQAWGKNFQQEHSVEWDTSAQAESKPIRSSRRRR